MDVGVSLRGGGPVSYGMPVALQAIPLRPNHPPPLSLEMVVPADCAAEFTDANTADEGRPRRRWTGHRPGRWWRLWRTRSWVAATGLRRSVRFDRVVVAEGCVLRGRGSIQGKRLTITMVTVVDPITRRSQKAMKEVD